MNKAWITNRIFPHRLAVALFVLFFLIASTSSHSEEYLRITYPSFRDGSYIDNTYIKNVLILAIAKSGRSAKINPSSRLFDSDISIIRSLINNEDITVMWAGSNMEMEEQARAIYFPIFKGILGYRLIVSNNNASKYVCNSKDIRDLTGFIFGLGYGWTGVNIFEDNGIPIIQADKISLYRFTSSQYVEGFSRSIFETNISEKELISNYPNLTVCKNLHLYYPHYLYFYVNKENEELYNAISFGLKKAFEDGSFDKLFFDAINGTHVEEQLNLKGKKVIELENNFMTEKTKNIPEELKLRFH